MYEENGATYDVDVDESCGKEEVLLFPNYFEADFLFLVRIV